MSFKYINKILNIIIKYKLNTMEISVFQDALLLNQYNNAFVLNRSHLRLKTGEFFTRQHISKTILSLENKGLIEQIEKHENLIQHKFCEGVFNV